MFNCGKEKHRFSETGYCDLFGKHGSFKEYEQMSKLSCYGLSADAIADVLLKDTRTTKTFFLQIVFNRLGQSLVTAANMIAFIRDAKEAECVGAGIGLVSQQID